MAITVTNVKGPGRRKASWSGQSGRVYTQTFQAITDDATIGPRAIMQSLGLRVGDYYRHPLASGSFTEWDYGSLIQSVDIEEAAIDGKQWTITLTYGPFAWQEQGGAQQDGTFDPFKVPPKVRWDDAKFERAVLYDTKTGKPILNTVGDPFDPPLKRDETRPNLVIVMNQEKHDINWVQQFKDHVNSDTFLKLFDPGTVKCASITAEREYHPDWGYYWVTTYVFEVRPILFDDDGTQLTKGWIEKVLNAGTREIKSNGSVGPVILSGAPVGSAVALTKAGKYDNTADPYYLEFSILPTAEFGKLNIPEDVLEAYSVPGQGGS